MKALIIEGFLFILHSHMMDRPDTLLNRGHGSSTSQACPLSLQINNIHKMYSEVCRLICV
jgi:hypothetical protein